MISLHVLDDDASVSEWMSAYLGSLSAPMDDMWEKAIVGPAPHFEIRVSDRPAGCYAVADDMLVQFFLLPEFGRYGREAFDRVLGESHVTGADVATNDPLFLSLCLDTCSQASVHTVLYEMPDGALADSVPLDATLRPVGTTELESALALQMECLSDRGDISGWLRGYTGRLVERGELHVLTVGGEWLGFGECRLSETQGDVAHVGMMVVPAHRGRGLATEILIRLCGLATDLGRAPFCSTTVENRAAQKAIARAGFLGRHRILRVSL